MKVIDLIIALQKLPANKEVVLDLTKQGSEMFVLRGIEDISEITTPDGDNYVMLSGLNYESSEN